MGFAPASVNLSGTAVQPMIQVAIAGQAPGTLTFDFGEISVGTASDPISVGVKNTGNIPVQIKSIASSDGQFTVDTTTPKTSLMLAAGAQTQFQGRFAAAERGHHIIQTFRHAQGGTGRGHHHGYSQ